MPKIRSRQRSNYSEKLRDPRWQKRRLETMERDDWACRSCRDKTKPLHVHHLWYEGEPWEAPDEALVTLCEDCHEEETFERPEVEGRLVRAFRRVRLFDLELFVGMAEQLPTETLESLALSGAFQGASESFSNWLSRYHAEVDAEIATMPVRVGRRSS